MSQLLDEYLDHLNEIIPIWGAWRLMKAEEDTCNKKCGTFSISRKRAACIANCQISSGPKRIKAIAGVNCSKQPYPKKCEAKKAKAIVREKKRLAKAKLKLAKLKQKGRA